MCLSTVTETHDPGIPSDGRTYFKVMAWVPATPDATSSPLYLYRFPFFEYAHGKVRLGDTLHDADSGKVLADDGQSYPLGFHVFDTLAAAQCYAFQGTAILEVTINKVVARGTQWVSATWRSSIDGCVTVARQMTLVRELEREPLRPLQDTV